MPKEKPCIPFLNDLPPESTTIPIPALTQFPIAQSPAQSQIALFISLMKMHHIDMQLRTNVLNGRTEVLSNDQKCWHPYTNSDAVRLRLFFEVEYGLRNASALNDAVTYLFSKNLVNPAISAIEECVWDGEPRLEHFLSFAMGCEDTPYTREVSRLIFAQGIHRAYEPGCKCDYMPVLVGAQGGGKSTLIRWLNINSDLYGEVHTFNGKEAYESIYGVWIGEVPELMALSNAKNAETIKAFLTAREDTYRPPYEKNTQTFPRRCVLIGTTNNPHFLNDLTGNRRFLPVQCRITGDEFFRRRTEIRMYIRRCWAEARKLYLQDEMPPYPNPAILAEIEDQQQRALEEDWRTGLIADYMARKHVGDHTCVLDLWYNALGMEPTKKPTRKDSLEISQMIRTIPGWIEESKVMRGNYGAQRYYVKKYDAQMEVTPLPKDLPKPHADPLYD